MERVRRLVSSGAMTIDPSLILAREAERHVVSYSTRDTLLYALGIGLGSDPADERQLRYVSHVSHVSHATEPSLEAFPTFAAVLGMSSASQWMRDPRYGLTFDRLVHGEQSVSFHDTLAPAGSLEVSERVVGVFDKGPGRGALIERERTVTDASRGRRIATIRSTTFARADGGFGGEPAIATRPSRPAGKPDVVIEVPTLPNQALLYCLSGDTNLIHWSPRAARDAGFERPILHGQCTFGIVAAALLGRFAELRGSALAELGGRFSAVAYPGETLAVEVWQRDGAFLVETWVRARNACVFSNSVAKFASP
jgi:acyl dehydratase